MQGVGNSIRSKLRVMIVTISAVVLIVTSAAFMAYEVISFKQNLVQNVSVLARVVADNSAAAVAFQNASEAAHVLSALKAEPSILEARLYDGQGKVFAAYRDGESKEPMLEARAVQPAGYLFKGNSLLYYEPVQQSGNRLGTLALRCTLDALYKRLRLYTGIVGLIAGGSLLMAYLLSNTLQRRISQPIIALADTAKIVSKKSDYSVRAPKYTHDEVGMLTDSFNQMLDKIEQSGKELKEAHDEISQHAVQLEKTVADRTAKLQQSIGELEAFSYSISHDMRAPLRVMSRYSQILIQDAAGKLDSTEMGYVNRIAHGAQRLDQLIQDALTYSRVSRAELQLLPTDVGPTLNSIIDQFPELQGEGADVTIDSPLHKVMAHEPSLSQCLSNLLVNAAKFVPKGTKPQIRIWTELAGENVRLNIKDNGIGIAPEDQERIFGMFARVHSEKVYEGTGIGLAIVKKAIERMGGRSGVESDLGKGSNFWIELKKGEG